MVVKLEDVRVEPCIITAQKLAHRFLIEGFLHLQTSTGQGANGPTRYRNILAPGLDSTGDSRDRNSIVPCHP
jgi:hypothetical protein